MAADTGVCAGDMVIVGRIKIYRRDDGALIGGAGKGGYCHAFRKWALGGENGEPPASRDDSAGMIVMPDGLIRLWDNEVGLNELTTDYFAIGSGQEYAMGAMFCSASAEDAVRAAIAHDAFTNGDVMILRANA